MRRALIGLIILGSVLAAIAWPVWAAGFLLWLLASFALGLIVARFMAPAEGGGDEGADPYGVGNPMAIRFLHGRENGRG